MTELNAIVLAAGKGTRMESRDLPKVMVPVNGKPMLAHVLTATHAAGVVKPVIVVGFLGQKVQEHFGDTYTYVWQRKRLGTGHAVKCAAPVLRHAGGTTLILYGDHPFITAPTLQRLAQAVSSTTPLALLSGVLSGEVFDHFGRVLTDVSGNVSAIVEYKDATEEERAVRRMNLGMYAIDNAWLWRNVTRLTKSPATGEYYLTELVAIATAQGAHVASVDVTSPQEAVGINTRQHLAEAEVAVSV